MKKYLILSAISLLAFTGCKTNVPSSNVNNNQTNSQVVENNVTQTPSTELSGDANSYFSAKAEKDWIDVELDKAEYEYRNGSLSADEFKSKKIDLEDRERTLERTEDSLEYIVERELSVYDFSGKNIEELLTEKRDVEKQENELELEEHKLEDEYRLGNITKDEFIQKQTSIVERETKLDVLDDSIENALERLGYDD
ncbi:MAG: hypothetical protein IAC55_00085 [Tyzzerella sp.]|uniref:Uncharacterized protein n=1 Tax=Candidatus Fimicola merdigallinarum TaxID=2840819 RepID=A0A9D9H3B2_9FIRM|nr:hypothetical protein [Candidatus Fimicola merdigallinarum]